MNRFIKIDKLFIGLLIIAKVAFSNATEVAVLTGIKVYQPWESSIDEISRDVHHKNSFSARLLFDSYENLGTEIFYQTSQVTVDSANNNKLSFSLDEIQLAAVKPWRHSNYNEYYGAGVGIARFQLNDYQHESEYDLSFSFFSGAKFGLTPKLSLLLDARVHFILLDNAAHINCQPDCNFDIKAKLWGNLSVNTGLVYRF